ncbi:MAG: cytochrome d ubiquinol oxidase subunit II [Verrucomicrobiota bacterium]|nr:cytochrome d ubiquinol oxidase subunit II [Verrucomicrobiota bacterium]
MVLETLWYAVIAIAILFYTVLDGFDLGVGALHLFARGDVQRRTFLNAIGPVWDGNEVWIVIVMGGLFAGFPNAYATVFSGFYSLLMFLIAGLIFRAAAIEFRSKQESRAWRSLWDVVFCVASTLVAFVLGVLLGNTIAGIPLNEHQDFVGGFVDFFHPYAILIGLTSISLFSMHGAIFLTMKTEGDAHATVRRWILPSIISFLGFYLLATGATLFTMPHMATRFYDHPMLLLFPLLSFLSIANIPYQVRKGNDGWAFVSSCASIAFLLILFGLGTFPTIVRSTINPDIHSLTIYNTASTHKTLTILLIVVAIGLPLVLAYGFWVYRIFRGKVKLFKTSY